MPDEDPLELFPEPKRELSAAIQEAHDIIEQAKAIHKPTMTLLLFSGGNDSITVLDTVKEHADLLVHVNTGIGIPQTTEFAIKTMSDSGIDWRELHPPIPYEELVLTHPVLQGLPGPGVHRIIYQRLKERPLRALLAEHRSFRGERFMLLTGVRQAESRIRMGYKDPVNRDGGKVWVNPLLYWKNPEMAEYRAGRELVTNEVAANLHMSGECLCGAMADQGPQREERELIRFFYPGWHNRMVDLEEQCRVKGLPYCEWGVKRPNFKEDGTGPMCASCEYRQPNLFDNTPDPTPGA